MTFPALKEYDSREADRENRERGKGGGGKGELRDKSHTKCKLPPKQLACNQRQSSLLSGQFDFHFSNEAFIFGLITGQAKLKLAARQSTDNSQLCRRSCEHHFLSLFLSPRLLVVEDEERGNEGGRERERKRANLCHNRRRLGRQKRPKNEGGLRGEKIEERPCDQEVGWGDGQERCG